ncbi:hypothetical protein B0H19DRAFT_1244351, partial [Mycena capillaripes]
MEATKHPGTSTSWKAPNCGDGIARRTLARMEERCARQTARNPYSPMSLCRPFSALPTPRHTQFLRPHRRQTKTKRQPPTKRWTAPTRVSAADDKPEGAGHRLEIECYAKTDGEVPGKVQNQIGSGGSAGRIVSIGGIDRDFKKMRIQRNE